MKRTYSDKVIYTMFKFIMQMLFVIAWNGLAKNPPEQYIKVRNEYLLFIASLDKELLED